MPRPVQSNCDAHDTIAIGQYGAVWSMGHTQHVCARVAHNKRRSSNTTSPCLLLHIPVVLNDIHSREITLHFGCGSRVVRVSDRGWPCHECESDTTKDPPCRDEEVSENNLQEISLDSYEDPECSNSCSENTVFHTAGRTHFWLNSYVNKQNCRIWSEANPQVYVETPLHPEKLTVWCALWAGGILLQKR
ncbi:hypothetical protein TNCV_404741 [Trichonephila clavipes]|nr:hypothetical protein TNCV_404741 [Trichonephila clavipes]